MAKDKLAEARLGGMDYALRRIKEIGVEEFEKELAMRNRNNMAYTMSPKDMQKETEEIQKFIIRFTLIVSICALYDEFDFGQKGIKRFQDIYMKGVQYINKGYAYLEEYENGILEELGIEIDFR